MPDALAEVEPKAAQPQVAENPLETEQAKRKKKPKLMKTVPSSLIKFSTFQKKEKGQAGATSPITKKPKENLEGPCGLGCIVISRCQRFNTLHCFVVFYCLLITSQGIVFGLKELSMETFLKDSYLNDVENLLLPLTYDISSSLVAVFIAYYGGKGHIPRWVTFASFLVGCGSLLFAYPYFTEGDFKANVDIEEDICQEMKSVQACRKTVPSFHVKYLVSFILGQTVQGVAAMILYILGIVFIDNSVAIHSTGIYIGIMEASFVFGYSLSYGIAAPLLKGTKNRTSAISVEDSYDIQSWLQHWWIYFGLVSFIAWSTLIPLSCFPHSIQGTAKIKAEKRKQPHPFGGQFKDKEFETSIKDLFATLWVLLKNPILICLALTKASGSFVFIGASEYLPLYIENQFSLTRPIATKIAGFVLLPAGGLGVLLGGIIVSTLHMSCKALMRFVMVTSAVSLMFFGFVIFINCAPVPFAGINEDYSGTGQLGNLTAPCNSHCRCSSSFYSAICGRDNIGYFSPCYAGCTLFKTLNDGKAYYNCSCIQEGLTTSDEQGDFIDARPGACNTKCYKLPLFIAFIFSTILFSVLSNAPCTLTILRIVSDNQRPLALSLTYMILRIFATIPGPILFKLSGDSSCLFRETEYCERKGNCLSYDKKKMAYLMVGLCSVCKVFAIFFTAIAYCLYKYMSKRDGDSLHIPVKSVKVKKKGKK
ncbi:solute carrier organic anion transporter family member 6A1 isoform X1 [Mustela erminea]|uniref:solute carrier organic anion transporter family member 6A1 isoform X1 n=1 Tax=Mustela erminea TaxID=36723 RepID=UPI001386E10D|nr:solute carrier organic anion transporter family member 6A1 isoform X1 [Mustela erminea]